ncbi:MAG: diaminopimelate epimerase [Candidatus Omnitrophica bacterium]|nr:diaminopimelate epimerase [Candidatus Omnitrophota bacterium]
MNFDYGINFTKAVASGNDFIILDAKDNNIGRDDINYSEAAKDLCRRNLSIGADGILVLEKSDKADYRMRIINPDGSEVDMCGNGARCSAMYAYSRSWGNKLKFETGAGIIEADVKEGSVKLKMSDPKDMVLDVKLKLMNIDASRIDFKFINTGVPHVVAIVDDLMMIDVMTVGREIREHEYFAPKGTNVNFVSKSKTHNEVLVRTYERGVEAETLACGTGSVASGIIMGIKGEASSPVNVMTKSGEILKIYFEINGDVVSNVYLEGGAKLIYQGRV